MKKKHAKHSIYCGILSATLLSSSFPMLTTQVQAEEKTATVNTFGDLVWEDTNQNGMQDAGEKGIEGITIELYRADGSKVGEQKTDKNGLYQFNALQEGDYFAHIVIPGDQYKMVSTKRFGWDGWTDYFHIKGDGDNKLDADVGLLSQKGRIGDTIWEDTNKNGKQDEGEPGISLVTLDLYNIDGKKIKTVTTDEKGHYQFTDIPNGYYYVKLNIPAEYDFLGAPNFGADQFSNYILVEGNTNEKMNAGLIKKQTEVAVESIKVEPSKIDAAEGENGTIKASVQPENATNKALTYTSKDPNVVTVDKDGNWKAIKVGATTMTVTSANGKTAEVSVTVTAKEVSVESIKVEPSKIDAAEGENGTIKASVQPENATNQALTYTSKDSNVVTVDKDGNWKAMKAGATTMTVTSANGKTAEISVTVKGQEVLPTSLSITPNESTYKGIKDSLRVQATVLPTNATNKKVTYTSSNTSVATIDSSGYISTRAEGSTTITVRTVNNISKSFTLYVDEVSGFHNVKVEHSGKMLTAAKENTTGQAVLTQSTSNGGASQSWEFKKVGSNYTIQNTGNGKYITDSNIPYEAGTKVLLSTSPGYFKITKIGTKKYTIKNASNGYILDMPMNYTHDGAIFQFFSGWSYVSTNEAFFLQ